MFEPCSKGGDSDEDSKSKANFENLVNREKPGVPRSAFSSGPVRAGDGQHRSGHRARQLELNLSKDFEKDVAEDTKWIRLFAWRRLSAALLYRGLCDVLSG